MKATIAVLNKRGEDATPAVTAALESLRRENVECFGMASPLTIAVGKDIRSLPVKNVCSSVIIGCAFQENESPLAKMEKAALAFDGRMYAPTLKPSSAIAVAEKLQREREKTAEKFVKSTEGDYSLIVAEPERIMAARDPIGVQTLYYGETAACAALGSNRKLLWRLGIEETRSFPPGHVGFVSREGCRFKPVKTLAYSEPKPIAMQNAANSLSKMLKRSVRLRLRGVKEVAVAFSGGLDSSVIAFLAKKSCVDVRLIHVSLRGQPETDEAKKAADELKLPIEICLFREEEVAKVAAKVVELIEEPSPVKAAIGIPFFWTAKKAADEGLKVLLAGQGADELFGGYQRYVTEYLSDGEEAVRKMMFTDVTALHESNIERDVKICSFHDVELRLPFASYGIAEFALGLPVELKIEKDPKTLRKLVLRKVAADLGLPEVIVEKPKKAVQYATGINSALRKLGKKHKSTVAEYVNKLFLNGLAEN